MLYLFLFGLCMGSFIQVVSFRFPLKLNFISGHSCCPVCHHRLSYTEMIPLISFIYLKGRCQHCHHSISFRYFVVEFMTAITFVFFYQVYGLSFSLLFITILYSLLLCISLIDIDSLTIYDAFLGLLVLLAFFSLFSFNHLSIFNRLFACLLMFIPLSILYFIKPHGLGYGDVKLLSILGFILGYPCILMCFSISVFSCLLYMIFMIFIKKRTKNQPIGFAPFISFGCLSSLILFECLPFVYLLYLNSFTI